LRRVIQREDVEARFRALLVDEGVDPERPTSAAVERAWAAMWRFRAEPVEGADPPEGEGVSALYGVHELPNGETYFELIMMRALVFYDGDSYDGMMHLYCSFRYAPTPELCRVGDGGTDYDEPEDPYWNDAMDLSGYRRVRELAVEPVALEITFEEA
jgi:hypothetical protein